MFQALWKRFKIWWISRSIRTEDSGLPVYESTADIRLGREHWSKLPEVVDAECGVGLARGGKKIKFAKEVLYSDGSFSSIEIHTDEESQRAFKKREDDAREQGWRALHPDINPSTSE